MNINFKSTVSCIILAACTAFIGISSTSFAEPVAGVTSTLLSLDTEYTDANDITGITPLSGITLTINQTIEYGMIADTLGSNGEDQVNASDPAPATETNGSEDSKVAKAQPPVVDYNVTAVAQVNDYVNVRKAAGESEEILGKLYKNCVGTVIGQEGDWTLIQSGSVEGYVKSEYIAVGDKDLVDSVVKYQAVVTADALKFRTEMNTECKVLGVARHGEELDILDDSTADDGWIRVKKGDIEAYVAVEFVDIEYDFDYAESKEEEAARLAAEAAAADASNASLGAQVANYGLKFVGNPYVWGGTSLTKGADCSGFVMSVYKKFGVSLPHSSYADRKVGRKVEIKQSAMRPGDIVCYSGHVAIYIGNGKIVHAASRRSGIKVSNAFYRKVLAVRRIF